MINRVVLVGRLTRDPELRRPTPDFAVTSFTVAVDNRFAKQEENKTSFISCTTFNKSAEFVTNYARKGSLVGIEGRLQSRQYDDKDGRRVFVTEVICDNVQLLESKAQQEQRNQASGYHNDPYANANSSYEPQVSPKKNDDFGGFNISDDDLPF